MTPSRLLHENLGGVPTRLRLDAFYLQWHKHEPELFFDQGRFLTHLQTFPIVDVMTFTYTGCQGVGVRRLIVGMKPNEPTPKGTRLVKGVHTKLYLCFSRMKKLVDAYTSSLNLTQSTNLNLTQRVSSRAIRTDLLTYFNVTWDAGETL